MEESPASVGGRPAVGNVLGFSLLLRDRQALLNLERRALAPGVRLIDYEAEVPGIEFPLRARGAAAFRRHRCRVRRLGLEVEPRALTAWLRPLLVGTVVADLRIDQVDLSLAGELEPGLPATPCLYLQGRRAGLRGWAMVALELSPRGRRLAVRPVRIWRLDRGAPSAALWSQLAVRLQGIAAADDPQTFVFDPVAQTLRNAFVGAGWRVPDLGGLTVQQLELSPERAVLVLARDSEHPPCGPVPGPGAAAPDRIRPHLQRAEQALALGNRRAAAAEIERLTDVLSPQHPARLAGLRWLAELAAPDDPAQVRRALQAWLHLRPRDDEAARALVLALGRAGDDRALAKRLAAECRLPHDAVRQARLELALATLLVDRLGERESGRGLLELLLARCVRDPDVAVVERSVRATLARALAEDAPDEARQQLDQALALTERAASRASLQGALARALAEHGHHRQALPLWSEAVSVAADDESLIEGALASARTVFDHDREIELLRAAIPHASAELRLQRRTALVNALLQRNDPTSRELARVELRALVRAYPQSAELALQLSNLEHEGGEPQRAAAILGQLIEDTDDPGDRIRLRLEQARLWIHNEQPERAWQTLQPALSRAPKSMEAELLVQALAVAPDEERDALVDRLAKIDDGPRSGQALLDRASRETDTQRADLREAAERLDDPRAALRRLAELSEAEDPEPWRALAEACHGHDDPEGEATARIEQGLRHLAAGQSEAAREALGCAHALRPEDHALALASAWLEITAGRESVATERLLPLPTPLPLGSPPLDDARLDLPDATTIHTRCGELLWRSSQPEHAAALLTEALGDRPLDDRFALETAVMLFRALGDAERHVDASAIAIKIADAIESIDKRETDSEAGSEESTRAYWLTAAVRGAEPSDTLAWLDEASALDPEDLDRLAAFEQAARDHGDEADLRRALQRVSEHPNMPDERRMKALREQISLYAQTSSLPPDPQADDGESPVVALQQQLLAIDGDDVQALLALGTSATTTDPPRAAGLWAHLLTLLPTDDPRRLEPSLWLARYQLEEDRVERAGETLLPLLELADIPAEVLELLALVTRRASDPDVRLRLLRSLTSATEHGPLRGETELLLARELGQRGRAAEGLVHASAATLGAEPGTAEHIDAVRAWLTLAIAAEDAPAEASARAELRRGLGSELSPKERRAEALLLAERLSDLDSAEQLVAEGLSAHPAEPLLLSTLKQIARLRHDLTVYLVALEAAVENLAPGKDRDRLASELALVSAESGDALRAHRALDRMSTEASQTDILLDLRDWTVRNLGLEREEMHLLNERLSAGPIDTGLLRRLALRVGEGEPTVEHLLSLARDSDPEVGRRIIEPALSLAEQVASAPVWMQVLRYAQRVGAHEAAQAGWPVLVERISAQGDDGTIADLVSLIDDVEQAGTSLDESVAQLLDDSLAERPGSRHLHRALARRIARRNHEPTARDTELITHLEGIAERYELPDGEQAELFIGMSERLDRRAAAELLAARARLSLRQRGAFERLIRALEAQQCWPEVLELLAARTEACTQLSQKVDTLKHLAHIAAEILGDAEAAIHHLEDALALAPTDPDLLLPLLDHHFSQTDLSRAIELTERVLEHVRMGDAAFSALAHRAADAAIAQDEAERAIALVERIVARVPDDAKALDRIADLRLRANDPERRVQLLASVATRQSGKARIEALEERARLLLDLLQRPSEAMEDLAAVVAEAPHREDSATLLARLYQDHGRFEKLIALYEADLPRKHGNARAQVLRQIAHIHRDELYDLPRAEQALRLAIDQLDASPAHQALADDLREELAANLERQGRFVDLAAYLEQQLEDELSATTDDPAPSPVRLGLLQTLARQLRDRLDDEDGAARIYEHLERWDSLSDDGLATLARWYRRAQRHEDLVRVLQLRADHLHEHSERRAAVVVRIAELLDGPLARPHDAAPYYLDAFVADPEAHANAGARARVLWSAVDAVANVRDTLSKRLEQLPEFRRPPLLTLLADVLAPHEDHEDEAEARYREALALAPEQASAYDGLGRLLSRQGRRADAAEALVSATNHEGLSPERLAEAAALGARNLIELSRFNEAEAVLRRALGILPESTRALLELARLYERAARPGELAAVLDRLAGLPLSSTTLAEVAYRRARLLEAVYTVVPNGPQGERARSLLLECLGINPRHAAARRALLALASDRREWSIVAHMHYLAIRDLAPGPQRAIAHLDLAATYLDHLDDPQSAMRNIESALQQAATDVVVANRTADLARRMPDARAAAERFERIAAADNDLGDASRARLWLLAADLRLENDESDAARAASQRVLDLSAVPEDATAAATRTLERLAPQQDSADPVQVRARLVAQLDQTPPSDPEEHARLLDRLHDVAIALHDAALVERSTAELLALAAGLDDGDDEPAVAAVTLTRDLLAAWGEYGSVVELCERRAQRAAGEQPERAAAILVEAAGFAWRGQQQPASAAALLARALQLHPDEPAALAALGELIHDTSDLQVAESIHRALITSQPPAPKLALLLAALASTRRQEDEALVLLRPIIDPSIAAPVRFEALGRLEVLLADRGEHDERRAVLTDLFELALHREDPRTGDLGLELARQHEAAGDRSAARACAETALRRHPEHRELLRLVAQMCELDEDWGALSRHQQQLAQLATDDEEQAQWLTRAARLHLLHSELSSDTDADSDPGSDPGSGPDAVPRRLLLQACEVAPRAPAPRIALLPLSFQQGRWDESIEWAQQLTHLVGYDEQILVLGALAQAYQRGERGLAREIGYRHSAEVARRLLLPGLQKTLNEVAFVGPLPRLDALLAAGSALTGGRRQLFDSLHTWSAERPAEAGLSLGLARLYEARGTAQLARHHYQLAAFLAADGPVPALVSRLPAGYLEDPELHRASTAPMETRSMLRETLAALRDHLAGLGNEGAPSAAPPHVPPPQWWPAITECAEAIVEPWRAILGVDLPMAWTETSLPGGIAVRNDRPPRILLSRACTGLRRPEFTFRLALATAVVALGTAVFEAGSMDLDVVLDAMGQLANPGHQPTGVRAQLMADVLTARDARNIGLTARQRASLADELAHWLTSDDGPARLRVNLHRSQLLLATRMCGCLDGALLTLARNRGLMRDDHVQAIETLRQEDATWLLRALSLR